MTKEDMTKEEMYQEEVRNLRLLNLTADEYERRVREVAERLKI